MKKLFTRIFLLLIISISSLAVYSQSVGGTVSGATAVCPNAVNSGFLMLNGYVGTILYWESTTNGGITWTNIGNPINSYSYSNLTQTTCYRVIVKNGSFPEDTSSTACITIIPPSVGGTLNGGGTFCGMAPGDTLTLAGNTGNVTGWQYSPDGGNTWITVNDTTTSLIYPPITQNRIYRTIVRNGTNCPTDTSSQAFFFIDPVTVAGSISETDTVCYADNGNTLNLVGHTGVITGWLSSTDNGVSWTSISNTSSSQDYNGLTQTTWFAVVVQSGSCDPDTALSIITVRAPVPVNAGNDTSLIKGKSFTLSGSGGGTPLWTPSTGLNNDTIFTPLAFPEATTTYVLHVTDAYGCTGQDAVTVSVMPGEFEGVISNLFTPDQDGINETWYIRGIENFPASQVMVFNIYGNKVFEKQGYTNDWAGTYNGAPLPDGTYYYIVKFDDSPDEFKGSVDILRK